MRFLFVGGPLAVDLLNTVVAQDGKVRDLLGTRRDVAAWVRATGLGSRGVLLAREPGGLRSYREALRGGLVAWAANEAAGRRLVSLLNRHLARDPEVAEVSIERNRVIGRRRSTGTPRDRLYGAVARSAAALLATGDPRRLRKCANPSCLLMFYDVSKAGRRRWCSMQTCGARAKVRAFRQRVRRPSRDHLPPPTSRTTSATPNASS